MGRDCLAGPRADRHYIAEDSPGYAAAFVRRIRDRARSLEEMAERGRVVPELEEPTVRELIVGSYRLVYEIEGADVHILGLIHGARDLATLWGKERLWTRRQLNVGRWSSPDVARTPTRVRP